MQSLGVSATEVEIIAAASFFNATIYAYAQCDSYKWLKTQQMKLTVVCTKMNAFIYITNLNQHFETVKKKSNVFYMVMFLIHLCFNHFNIVHIHYKLVFHVKL